MSIAYRAGKIPVAARICRNTALVLVVPPCVGKNHTYAMKHALKGDTARDCLLYVPHFQAVGNFDIDTPRVNRK